MVHVQPLSRTGEIQQTRLALTSHIVDENKYIYPFWHFLSAEYGALQHMKHDTVEMHISRALFIRVLVELYTL